MQPPRWYTSADLAGLKLPEVPATDRGVQLLADRLSWRRADLEYPANPAGCWRKRQGRGGGYEYTAAVLPLAAQIILSRRERGAAKAETAASSREDAHAEARYASLWTWFEGLPDRKKAEARERLDMLEAVRAIETAGHRRTVAMMEVAVHRGVALRTLNNWASLVAGVPREHWLPSLAPRHAGRSAEVELQPEAWAFLREIWLTPERRTFAYCHRLLGQVAAERGWTLPSAKTLERRLADIPAPVQILAREGVDALKRLYPAQRRDRSIFHAMEAVNADGHKFDVFVRFEDGAVGRPVLTAFQDLYSGKIVAWRLDRSENKEQVLLAFGDLVETYGVPDQCIFDNGRNFTSKWLTGGSANRFRFKIKESDPVGVLTGLGVAIHFTTPYSGQSKPIERAFRDLANTIAKHPRCAGAWTGNTVDAKPENYGSKAVPFDVFETIVSEGIAEHNARPGRRSAVANGQSFDQVFAASYAEAPIRRVTAEQSRLWLLAAEAVSVRSDATIHIAGNRYWCEALIGLAGSKVVARFDPDDFHAGLHVYRADGAYVAHAPCIEDTGFLDAAAARQHGQARRAWMRAQRELLNAERTLGIDVAAAMLPKVEQPAPMPPPKVIRPVFASGNLAVKADMSAEAELSAENSLAAFQRGVLRLVKDQET